MNIKDVISDKELENVPLLNSQYYSNIYKKTEKIACAVFAITDVLELNQKVKDEVRDIRSYAKDMLSSVVLLLSLESHGRRPEDFGRVLRSASLLRSFLFVLAAERAIRPDFSDILAREIDSVLQYLHDLYGLNSSSVAEDDMPSYVRHERRRVVPPTPTLRAERRAVQAPLESASVAHASRREAILAIVREKGVVGIKDISDGIKDVSEKTIQRELLDMIRDNILIKEGERRWSKYRLF